MDRYANYNPIYTEDHVDDADNASNMPDPEGQERNQKRGKRAERGEKKINRSSEPSPLSRFAARIKGFFTNQTTRWIFGLFTGALGVYLAISFISYTASCVADQSAVNNEELGIARNIENAGGEGGARLSEFLINDTFGLGSAVIILWLFAMTLKMFDSPVRFKSVNFTIKCLVALITVSLIIGLVTIGVDSPVNWGGLHGRYVNEFVVHFVGWSGAVVLCIFMFSVFVVICLRDVINWILRIRRRRAAKRAREAAIKAAEMEKQRQLEEMREREIADAIKAGDQAAPENESQDEHDNAAVTFSDNQSGQDAERGLYDSDPDDLEMSSYIYSDANDDDEKDDSLPLSTHSDNTAEDESANDESCQTDTVNGGDDEAMVVNVNQIATIEDKKPARKAKYKFPPFDLLVERFSRISVDEEEQLENKERIKRTLSSFKIPITKIEATVGPTITLYEIVPEKGIKISSIRSLVDDIALSLAAIGVRIIAPIPGKGTVGIEVANKDPQTVSMRTVLQSKKFQESKYKLPIALGSTISNEVYVADLAKMPHLLVAGATGQGKSVGLNAIIASLLYSKTPDELKLVLIDPKRVEFSLYKQLENHYLAKLPDDPQPVVTDMNKVISVLSSLCVEMENRYTLCEMANTRNIEEYNAKWADHKLLPTEGHKFMPYIVVIVDEWADLLMTQGKEVEMPVGRLAQKARAVGIHVILATQRPSTDVITGVIKANFPARIAFKTGSSVDSRTILDTVGAQQLIGRGDMLISNNSEITRVQCAFMDTPEVEALCSYVNRQPYPTGPYILPEPVVAGQEGEASADMPMGKLDPLFEECARLVATASTASTSNLQRRYSIGFNRAGKIMDQLEKVGIVGPARDGKPRDVLVDPIGLESILSSII